MNDTRAAGELNSFIFVFILHKNKLVTNRFLFSVEYLAIISQIHIEYKCLDRSVSQKTSFKLLSHGNRSNMVATNLLRGVFCRQISIHESSHLDY